MGKIRLRTAPLREEPGVVSTEYGEMVEEEFSFVIREERIKEMLEDSYGEG